MTMQLIGIILNINTACNSLPSGGTKIKEMSKVTHDTFNRKDVSQLQHHSSRPDLGFYDIFLLWVFLTI